MFAVSFAVTDLKVGDNSKVTNTVTSDFFYSDDVVNGITRAAGSEGDGIDIAAGGVYRSSCSDTAARREDDGEVRADGEGEIQT